MWKTTHWSQIIEAQQDNREAMEELCTDYWTPVYKIVRRYYENDAEDMVQEFFVKFLENKWIGRVSQTKGKFRTFVITVLLRFLNDKHKKRQLQFEKDILNLEETSHIKDFNRYWIETLFSIVSRRMHAQFTNGNFVDYAVFRMYYEPASTALLRCEDIVCLQKLLYKIKNGNKQIDRILRVEVQKFAKITYVEISQAINLVLQNHWLQAPTTCHLVAIDFKVSCWKQFSSAVLSQFNKFADKYNWHEKDKSHTIRFLNTLMQNEDLTHTQKNHLDHNEEFSYKNRIALENIFPEYIEKYQLRHNRRAIDCHFASLIVPCMNETPSLLGIANYLNISKYQVEKSLETTRKLYKKIMRDEVARYVYPDEVSQEIKYLYSLL